MTAKKPMSGSPEKRRDCIAQRPLRSPIFDTRVKLRHYADQLNFLFNLGTYGFTWKTPVTEILRLPTVESKPRPQEMLGQFLTSFSGNCGAKFWKNFLPGWRLRSTATKNQARSSAARRETRMCPAFPQSITR